jgi:hypothetical protein
MTVVTTVDNVWFGDDVGKPCSLCKRPVQFPFMEWDCSRLLFCNVCCKHMKQGFIKDLIDIETICAMQKTGVPEEMWSRGNEALHVKNNPDLRRPHNKWQPKLNEKQE